MIEYYKNLILKNYPSPDHRTEKDNESYCMYEKALGDSGYVCKLCVQRETALQIINLIENSNK